MLYYYNSLFDSVIGLSGTSSNLQLVSVDGFIDKVTAYHSMPWNICKRSVGSSEQLVELEAVLDTATEDTVLGGVAGPDFRQYAGDHEVLALKHHAARLALHGLDREVYTGRVLRKNFKRNFIPWSPADPRLGCAWQKIQELVANLLEHPLQAATGTPVVWDLGGDPGGTALNTLKDEKPPTMNELGCFCLGSHV